MALLRLLKVTVIFLFISAAITGVCPGYNVYYGNLHSHCSYSDGIGSPQEAFEYARDSAQVDIQALTDHTHMLTSGEYSTIKSLAASYTEDGVYVAIAGQEHGSLSTSRSGAFGHMNFYEAPGLIPQYQNGDDYRYNLAGTYSWLVSHDDDISGAPLYGVFNHPYYSGGCEPDAQFHHFAYSVTGDSAMALTEIRNGKRWDDYEPEYLEVLDKGWHVGVAANQDNHEGMWGDQPNPNSGNDIYLTGILADTLTKDAVLAALRDRRTFAVEVNPKSDRMGLLFQCEGNWMGKVFETSADTVGFDITVWAETEFITLELVRNGTQVAYMAADSNHVEWSPQDDPPMGESYYYVRAQQVDGDHLWSSPIWVISTSEEWDPISQVNADDAYGEPLLYGQSVDIRGVVTVGTGTFAASDNDIFVQDATGGVNVFDSGTTSPGVSVGDSVWVSGYVDHYMGLTRITSPTVSVAATGVGAPGALLITTGDLAGNGELYEGRLVRVEGCEITGGSWPDTGYDGSVTISDGSGDCELYIDRDTDIDGSPEPTTLVDVVGVVTQYDIAFPYHSGYRLQPRSTADISTSSGIEITSVDPDRLVRILPNPARDLLRFEFGPEAGSSNRHIALYDVGGRLVASTVSGPGDGVVEWRPLNRDDGPIPSGIYFARIESGGVSTVRKVVLIR
jgi:hypothetical protein